jgi:hypothetical protein
MQQMQYPISGAAATAAMISSIQMWIISSSLQRVFLFKQFFDNFFHFFTSFLAEGGGSHDRKPA